MIKLVDQINEINKKIIFRNKTREEFALCDEKISSIYSLKIQRLKKKSINFLYYFLYYIIVLLIILLYIYKKLNQDVYLIIYLSLVALSFSFLIIYFLKRKKANKLYDKYKVEFEANKQNKELSISLNLDIATSSLCIICLTENYYELTNIKDNEMLLKRWHILFNEYIDAINKKFNNDATIEDYIYYYQKWLETN